MAKNVKVIVVFILMIIYLIMGSVHIGCAIGNFSKCKHAWCSVVGTVMLGLGMFTYRLLAGLKTSIAKLIHMFIMLTGGGCIGISIYLVNHKDIKTGEYDSIHRYPGYIIWVALGLQVVIAVVFFICWYNSRTRYYIAPFHDMVGVWIYIVLVGCCIAATLKWKKLDNKTDFLVLSILSTSMVNVAIVLVLVLSPYFEWDIVL